MITLYPIDGGLVVVIVWMRNYIIHKIINVVTPYVVTPYIN